MRLRLLLLALLAPLAAAQHSPERELKVCADPNNLPFSNEARQGFENKIVEIVAQELHARITYVWWAQRRGNIRETLNEGLCDLIPGVASGLEMLGTTRPYYRSTYVAVTRPGLEIRSFDDPRLRTLRIGVQMIGDDFSNTPPAHALSRRGIIANVRGYMVYGDYADAIPQAPIIAAIGSGEIDVAFAWGPIAAYLARTSKVPLTIRPVESRFDGPQLPMVFDISMGVRKNDHALQQAVDAALQRRAEEVGAVLKDYGVPLLEQ